MSIVQTVFDLVISLIRSAGYAGIFGLMVLESATVPIPSEVVLPWSGYLVFTDFFNFWAVVIVASLGSLLGTLIDYAVGLYLGRAAILRYGRYVHLNEGNLVSTEKWFNRYGPITVLFARFVPLVRTVVAFPAGIAEMKITRFIAYSMVGIVIWDVVLVYVGYLVGPSVQSIINLLSSGFTLVEILAVVIGTVVLFFYFRKSAHSDRKPDDQHITTSTTEQKSYSLQSSIQISR